MITLKELVDSQVLTQKTDEELVVEWLEKNDLVEKGIKMISYLSQNKISSLKDKHNKVINNITRYGSGNIYLEKYYGEDIAFRLDDIIVDFICGFEPNDEQMEWLRKTIPTLNKPLIFWREFYDFLEGNGIYFKGTKNKKVFLF